MLRLQNFEVLRCSKFRGMWDVPDSKKGNGRRPFPFLLSDELGLGLLCCSAWCLFGGAGGGR